MAHARKFRFGVQSSKAASGEAWAALARRAEELGYATLLLPDHFGDQFSPTPAMMAAADATAELRVGALVFDNDYRHPVVLAKEVATVDRLSGGRVEFGLGAGWLTSDYEQAGIPKDPTGARIERMLEGLAVMKALWADGTAAFKGRHYHVEGIVGLPKPTQRPHPPILLGGGGRRMLGVAAKEADIVGINIALKGGAVDAEAARNAVAAQTDQKLAWVREAAGDRFDDIELNMLIFAAFVTDDRRAIAEAVAPGFGLTPDEALEVPHAWVGTTDEIAESLEGWRDRWQISYWVVPADVMEAVAPVVALLAGT